MSADYVFGTDILGAEAIPKFTFGAPQTDFASSVAKGAAEAASAAYQPAKPVVEVKKPNIFMRPAFGGLKVWQATALVAGGVSIIGGIAALAVRKR